MYRKNLTLCAIVMAVTFAVAGCGAQTGSATDSQAKSEAKQEIQQTVSNQNAPSAGKSTEKVTEKAAEKTTEKATEKVAGSANVGEYVTFGNYEQDGNTGNGAEPIEWLVLDKQGDKLLVISKYALDSQPYNTEAATVTWETCTLRNWLNTEFYNTAFSDSEKAKIIKTSLENPNNPKYGINGGNTTSDNVFCLSYDEAKKYFTSEKARMTKATSYALSNGAFTASAGGYAGYCDWMLRTPGGETGLVTDVSFSGDAGVVGVPVNTKVVGTRPALWIEAKN